MSEKDDGGPGPAVKFPDVTPTNGVSLRDWFAGQAITSICPRYGDRHGLDDLMEIATGNNRSIHEELAVSAYKIADAMLTARSHQEDKQ